MKIVFFVLLLAFNFNLLAANPNFEQTQCPGVFKEFFSKNIAEFGEWKKVLPDSFLFEGFRFYPKNGKDWSEIQISKAEVVVRTFDGEALKEAVVKPDCRLSFKTIDFPAEFSLPKKTEFDFDDKKLHSFLQDLTKNKAAVFYLWSPKFSYSVTHYPYVQKYAHDMGIEFVPLLDSRVSTEEAKRALHKAFEEFNKNTIKKNRFLASQENVVRSFVFDFYLRFGFSHYPISFIAHNQKIHPRWITGVMTENGFKSQTKKFIKELK